MSEINHNSVEENAHLNWEFTGNTSNHISAHEKMMYELVGGIMNGIRGELLLEVIDHFGLLVQLSDVHQPLCELPTSSIHNLVAHQHLPSGI